MWHKLNLMVLAAAVVLGLISGRPALAVMYTAFDLNPNGFKEAYATGISGTQQVGYGSCTATGYHHA